MPQFQVQDVRVDRVQKSPKNFWDVATVIYTTSKGDQKEKKIVSFGNPAVFAKVKDLKSGTEISVTYAENDQYFNWAKVDLVDVEATQDQGTAKPSPVKEGKVLGNQYETRDERNTRQLHIIRQSSLSNAINMLTPGAKAPLSLDAVLTMAQELVDFVYGVDEALLAETSPETETVSEA